MGAASTIGDQDCQKAREEPVELLRGTEIVMFVLRVVPTSGVELRLARLPQEQLNVTSRGRNEKLCGRIRALNVGSLVSY